MRFCLLSVDEFEITRIELYNILKNINVSIINVKNEKEAINILQDKKYSINAIVWTMNTIEESTFHAISRLKSIESCMNVPVVIISKFTDKKHIIKAIEAGAVEFIAKPYDEDIVVKKIYRILGIPYEKALDFSLDEDITTFNFSEMLSREVKGASRGGHPLSFILSSIILDESEKELDDEKKKFISLLLRIIKNKIRETDTVFQYGSDRFIMLLPYTDKAGVEKIEKKLKEILCTNTLIKNKKLNFELLSANAVLPDDGKIKEKILEVLEERLSEKINSINVVKT